MSRAPAFSKMTLANPLALADDAEEQMLRTDVVVPEAPGLVDR